MNHITKFIIEDSGNWRGNFWTAIGSLGTIITVYFGFKSLNNKANKLILDRFVNENIETDVLEHITFIKEYENEIRGIKHTIPKGMKTNIYIKKNTEVIKEYRNHIEQPERTVIYRDWSIFITNLNNNTESPELVSERFDHKIFVLRDLAKYTNVNEIYSIFKK